MAIDHGGNYDSSRYSPTLNVHCSESEATEVFVYWGGHEIPERYYGYEVGSRFDSRDAVFERWNIAENRERLISRDSRGFIAEAIFAVRFYLQFEADGHQYYAEFPMLRLWDVMVSEIEYTGLCQ